MIETTIVLIAFGCGVAVGRMWDQRLAIADWREGYESCKRDWDDWERARTRHTVKSSEVAK